MSKCECGWFKGSRDDVWQRWNVDTCQSHSPCLLDVCSGNTCYICGKEINNTMVGPNIAPGEIVDVASSYYIGDVNEPVSCAVNTKNMLFTGQGDKNNPKTKWAVGQKYRRIVWEWAVDLKPNSLLEIGPYGLPIFDWGDTIDNTLWFDYNPTWEIDITKEKIPVKDNYYDLVIASEVFEHLWPNQKQVFDECMRVSRYLIIAVPYRWSNPLDNEGHDDIDEQTVRGWFGRYPNKWELVSDRAYGSFGEEDTVRRWHRMVALYDKENTSCQRWMWR